MPPSFPKHDDIDAEDFERYRDVERLEPADRRRASVFEIVEETRTEDETSSTEHTKKKDRGRKTRQARDQFQLGSSK